ncbi:MFS transporter [Novosphingobium sp. Gsoil 351]|uniref:MFS transporter n=1 Tax=Novosphingobium sp. Gsoil 351 TaxID=2675225 RepID=UPI0012B4E5F3|nr:MFS transporter [Novosphingobium sp. Gsoil 351]QGN55801.1 MFS transporter [Novosphingobium sp. Gsoil 351]
MPGHTRLELGGLLGVMLASFTVPLTVAYNVGAIVREFGASVAQAGVVATAQGLGTAVGALAASRLVSRVRSRRLFVLGLLALVISNALSSVAPGVQWLTVLQATGGIGTGAVVAVVMATAARTARPEMTYGLINGSLGALIVVLGFVMPQVIELGGAKGAYLLYAGIAAAGLLAAMVAPDITSGHGYDSDHRHQAGLDFEQKNRVVRASFVALTGFGIFFFAQAGVGAFVERVGAASGVALTSIGHVFAVGGVLTIVGPLIAGWIGARFGATLPLILVTASLCGVLFGLMIVNSPLSFFISSPLFTVLPAILMPSFLGALAVIDRTGQSSAMQPAFATLGGAFGPLAAGMIVQWGGFDALGWYSIAIFLVGSVLMATATMGADKQRPRDTSDLMESRI